MSENKSCPFCGNEKIEALHMGHGGVSAYCYECEAEGPPRSTEAEAMEAWSRRAPAPQAQRVPLSDAEIGDFWEGATGGHSFNDETRRDFVRSIEQAHGITQEKQG